MTEIACQSAAGLAARRARAELLEPIRTAPTVTEALSRCADLIERRPEPLLDTDVHLLLEACAGLGVTAADGLQDAAGLHRAYSLAELPFGKQCALLAVMRLTGVRGQTADRVVVGRERARVERERRRSAEAKRMLAAGEPVEEVARIGKVPRRTVRRWRAELRGEAAAA